jgi:putative ABC transport system permease protein
MTTARAPDDGPRSGRPPRAARLWVSLLIATWPATFRQRHAADMGAAFEDAWIAARERGRLSALLVLVRTTRNLLGSALAEHIVPTTRDHRTKRMSLMDGLGSDLRYAFRSLARRPGFTLMAALTLALGVGANTAIFSVVNGVLLRPLPWPDQDRLIRIASLDAEAPTTLGNMSHLDLLDVDGTQAFEAVIGYSGGTDVFTADGEAEAISAVRVNAGLLKVFGMAPLIGRDLTLADGETGPGEVVVLSHAFWTNRLGADPNVVGASIELSGRPHMVVGVAPPGFEYPVGVQLWKPYDYDFANCDRGCQTLAGIGRLSPGTDLEAARSEVDALAAQLSSAYPESNLRRLFQLKTLEETTVGSVRTGLWLLLGVVGFVLLIACANVANLMLARAQTRVGEVGLRSALGASGFRLGTQVILESLLLAAAGSAIGLVLAFGGTALLRRISTATIPRIDQVAVDTSVLAFTAGVALLVAILFGLGPALRAARTSPMSGLRASGRGSSASRAEARSRSLLLASEVALCLMLLAGAGLLLKSFARLYAVDPGYQTEGIVRFSLTLPEASYPDIASIADFYRQLEERLASEPGVEAVGSAFGPPLGRGDIYGDVAVEGQPEPAAGEATQAGIRPVTPGFLETLRIPVLRGRGITASDDIDGAVVNERFARENFPGEDALGARVRVYANFGFGSPTWTIVGIIPDIASRSLAQDPPAEIYVPHASFGPNSLSVHVRTAPGAPEPDVRRAVRAVDPKIPVRALETVEDAVARQLAPARFFLSLVGAFALLALVLSATGLYGVAAFLASRRKREVGIRVALGATRLEVLSLILAQGLRPALWGVAVGLGGAWVGSRAVESLPFEVERADPLVYAAVVLIVLAVVVLACLVPARGASRVDPVEALRAE